MNLAPLADVVAYLDCDPSRLASMSAELTSSFDAVWSPARGCLMATRVLPYSVPDGDELRVAGIAFAEGRDSYGHRPLRDLPLTSLSGDVGFARADSNKIVVVRSGPGTVPWYAWQDRGRALVTTTFTELVRLLPVTPELDPLVCAMWANLQAVFPDGRSFVRGVTVIPPGHTAQVSPGRPVQARIWWDPWPDRLPWPSHRSRADHVQRFREAVLSALEREVAEEPVNLLTLSGGVDSSSLAYLVRRHLGRPLATLSFVPPEGWPEAAREASYLDPLVADLGICRHLRLPLDNTERLVLAPEAPPVVFPVLNPALQVLPRLVRGWGVEVLLGGEWADEVCGGWFALPDWLDSISAPRLLARTRALPTGVGDLKAWAKRQLPGRPRPGPWPASLADWVRPEVNEEYRMWVEGQLRQLRASSAPHRYQRALLTSQDGGLPMNWEVCSFLGLRRSFPFLTAGVLEVVSACHPIELLGPGSKRLERQAFAGLVAERYLRRRDKGGWRSEHDDAPVEPPPVPGALTGAFREDLGLLSPMHKAGVAIISRFAERLGRRLPRPKRKG